jgi:hypothetical protein
MDVGADNLTGVVLTLHGIAYVLYDQWKLALAARCGDLGFQLAACLATKIWFSGLD